MKVLLEICSKNLKFGKIVRAKPTVNIFKQIKEKYECSDEDLRPKKVKLQFAQIYLQKLDVIQTLTETNKQTKIDR